MELDVSAPASEESIRHVEAKLGIELPASFRHVLATVAARFRVRWRLPESAEPPFGEIFSGGFGWDLDALESLQEQHREWLDCFSNPDDAYDRVWYEKLAIASVPNGDMIGIDLRDPAQPLVYLSHEDGAGHGAKLGRDFADAVDRWSQLGFVGPEDWQWIVFTDGPDGALAPEGANALRWREWFGNDREGS